MTKRKIIFIAIAVVVIVGVMLWLLRSSPQPTAQAQPTPPPVAQARPTSTPTPAPAQSLADEIKGEYPQLSLKTMSRDAATKIYVERLMKDPTSEGKIPLNFYGKVVDQDNQPVTGAKVHLGWNTNGVPGGTAYLETSSDGNGLFSLTGQHGKMLEVRVDKEGYYTVEGGAGALAFEYAYPASPNYYEPDSNNPVIFHLRKKGEGAKLFSKNLVIHLNATSPQTGVNLMQGDIQPDGVLTITSDTSQRLRGAQPFPWTVTFSMSEGGLVETAEQFPFQAPESGYASTAVIDETNTDRSIWSGLVTRSFYFYLPSANVYGRITMRASSSLPLILDYVYNPQPGSRTLEPAP